MISNEAMVKHLSQLLVELDKLIQAFAEIDSADPDKLYYTRQREDAQKERERVKAELEEYRSRAN